MRSLNKVLKCVYFYYISHFPFPIPHFTAGTRGARASRPVWRAAEPQHASPSGSIFCVGGWVRVYTLSFMLRSVGQAWDQVQGLCIP